MSPRFKNLLLISTTCLAAAGCGNDDGGGPSEEFQHAVIANYATLGHAVYSDSLDGAEALKSAIDAFTADPTEETLAAARTAWIDSRLPYRQTEAYRFYGGPIDDPDADREVAINSWPLDEVYIDYVVDDAEAGVINDVDGTPTIDADTLSGANFANGETQVMTGYHAIEFLLWGQDLSADGPGARPFTDYVTGDTGTAANQDRRRTYLQVTANLLVADLGAVVDGWAPGATNYAADFNALPPKEALGRILTGFGSLSYTELPGERMLTAYENKSQEDEHSCFSDTTLDDLIGNARSLENVYLGRYGSEDGPGIDAWVASVDPELNTKVSAALAAAIAALEDIPGPFDQAILGDDASEGRTKVLTAIRAIQKVGDFANDIASTLDVQITVE
jgi:putative iron-regulated protein